MSDTHYFPVILPARPIRTRPPNSALRASDSGSFGCCLAQTESRENKLTSATEGVFPFLYMKEGCSVYGEV